MPMAINKCLANAYGNLISVYYGQNTRDTGMDTNGIQAEYGCKLRGASINCRVFPTVPTLMNVSVQRKRHFTENQNNIFTSCCK